MRIVSGNFRGKKIDQAKALKIKIITEKEWYKILNS